MMNGFKIKFYLTKSEKKLVEKIVNRARKLFKDRDRMDICMDITACHCNGSPLDFSKLLAADNFSFIHDVAGIARHIDRETGKLGGCFLPRCSL